MEAFYEFGVFMNQLRRSILFSLALLLFILPTYLPAQFLSQKGGIIIKYSSKFSEQAKSQFKQKLGKQYEARSIYRSTAFKKNAVYPSFESQIEFIELKKGKSLEEFLALAVVKDLLASVAILDVEENHSFELSSLPNDPELVRQWGLENFGQDEGRPGADIQADEAWDLQTQGSGVLGLVDTGVDFAHPDLAESIWQNLAEDADGDGRVLEFINGRWQLDPDDLDSLDNDGNGYIDDLIGWDFVNDDNNPFDDNGHGTHVAGIIGAQGNNGLGVSGMAWDAEIMVLKAFDRNGQGSLSEILPALEYARKMGVSLTNNSWGSRRFSRSLREEIEAAKDSSQIFVAAAGNGGYSNPEFPMYPASYTSENIISVSASDRNDRASRFASYGSRSVDLYAPGQRIYSTEPRGRYGSKSGTSMAAGFVSGALLLLEGYISGLTMAQKIQRLLNNTDSKAAFLGRSRTGGRLNVYKLLNNSLGQTSVSGLQASFTGALSACVNQNLTYINTSIIPDLQQTTVSWQVDDQEVSTDFDLNYSFSAKG